MNAKLLKVILDDETLTDEQITVLLMKAQKQAANQHFWADDDEPTDEELERFYKRYEFEIYDLAKAINSSLSVEVNSSTSGILAAPNKVRTCSGARYPFDGSWSMMRRTSGTLTP